MPEATEADTIRILVATDNHVGYEERDPIRKDDSWKTFDEILNIARKQDVDMVLLSGDLFHDNKPSRKAMYQVMRSLRKNCLGMKPCQLDFLSDANEVFDGAFGHVNYQDPDINISIPVFSIHGNHDDPSGDGHFCSLDLLQVAGLVNYFGRVPEADNIQVKPVLLQKGRTKLALYGLSNVRDERMFRTFRDHRVKWFRPGQQTTDFFNLLAVHQNHHAHTATGYLPENFLPEFLDLVVWGHEHECLIDPQQNGETGFYVMQPGSSVATSLVPGEAVSKHVAILTITGKDFKVDKVPLKTVRPFVCKEIVLAQDKRFKGLDKQKENRQALTKRLMQAVDGMIVQANQDWLAVQDDPDEIEEEERPLPLIRLKVEYTAPEGGQYDVENPQRFSNRFVGKVANTNDVVYFYRKKKTTTTKTSKADATALEEAAETLNMDVVQVGALVQKFLASQSLKILPQAPFGDAVNQFVNKDDKHAMETFVLESLAAQLKDLLALGADEEDLENAMEDWRKKEEARFAAGEARRGRKQKLVKPRPEDWDSDMEGHWEDQPGVVEYISAPPPQGESSEPVAPTKTTTAARGQGRAGARVVSDDDDEDVVMNDEPAPAPAKKRAPASRTTKAAASKATATKRAPARATRGKDDEDEDMFVAEDDSDDPPAPPTTRRGQSSRAAATRSTRQTTLNFSQSQAARGTQVLEISDDEISEDDAFESMPSTRNKRR